MPTIEDFLCLKFADGIIAENEITWNISPNYYSNQRSSVCFMSLERCNITFKGNNGQNLLTSSGTMIRCNINGQNSQVTDNLGTMLDIVETRLSTNTTNYTEVVNTDGDSVTTNILGDVRNNAVKYHNSNPMRLLVSARPSVIKINIQNSDLVSLTSDASPDINKSDNYIILRFEYDDLTDTQREFKDQYTRSL